MSPFLDEVLESFLMHLQFSLNGHPVRDIPHKGTEMDRLFSMNGLNSQLNRKFMPRPMYRLDFNTLIEHSPFPGG